MRNKWMAGCCACGLLLVATACSRSEHAADALSESSVGSSAESAASAPAAAPAGSAPAAPADAAGAPDAETQLQSAALTQDDGERRFIRTARVEFRVRDVHRSALEIEDLVARFGGYVARNDIRNEIDGVRRRSSGDGWNIELTSYTTRAELRVRVPSARAQEFLRALARQVEFLDRRRFEAVDAQLELLRQQLAYARQQQAQQALGDIAAEPGKTRDKTGAVQARVDAQGLRDEATIARKDFEDRVALATIELAMHQTPKIARTQRPDLDVAMRRDGPGFFVRLGHSLAAGWHGLLAALVALAAVWPLWLALAVLIVGVRQWRRRNRRASS